VRGVAEPVVAEWLADWQHDTADIMASLGSRELPHVLDRSLRRLVPFDLTVIFAYPDGARPLFLHDGLRGHEFGPALENYLNGAYLLDPFYTACAQRVPPGLYRMRDFAPDAFFSGEYVNSWEVHPCISMESGSLAEEIGYMVPLKGGFMASYSLMRRNGGQSFSEIEMEILSQVEPVVRQAISLHWRDLTPGHGFDAGRRGAIMELAFESFAADLLSGREALIVQMILRGHSTLSIANTLGIAEGTVKNHRKSIYAKLGITSQQELFARFIRHVLA
jgi:DNA-binding CsgD family transcriptional regulator